MKQVATPAVLALFVLACAVVPGFSQPPPAQQAPKFVPASLTSIGEIHTHVGEINYPIDTLASGIVSLLVNLDADGRIQEIQTLQDVPTLTAVSLTAVQNWTFSPATLDGKAVASAVLVNVAFNPSNFRVTDGPTVTPLTEAARQALDNLRESTHFSPPLLASAAFAQYPVNSIAFGSVVTQVIIGDGGGTSKPLVIRGLPRLLPIRLPLRRNGFSGRQHIKALRCLLK